MSTRTAANVEVVSVDVDGLTLSGLRARPCGAVHGHLLALHGGSSAASYWDSPVDPTASLVRLAAHRGWDTLAMDRPGYGASRGALPRGMPVADQARVVVRVAEHVWGRVPQNVFVVAHSLGALVTFELALRQMVPTLVGISVGGVPAAFTEEQQAGLAVRREWLRGLGPKPAADRNDPSRWFGPEGTWSEELLQHRAALVSWTPQLEFEDVCTAPALLPTRLGDLTLPVQWAAAEHEWTTAPADDVLTVARTALVRAPIVDLFEVEASGHNLSLGHAARDYHLRVLSFAEQCRVVERPEP